jgi:adenylate cyclase
MSERWSAREVVGKLNKLYRLCVPEVPRHGGHANKFIGDGMLAVFGASERHPDHADRAVAAAVEIAPCVQTHFRGELWVGIGVNSGRVLVGTVGGGGRLDFTVIGDAVNTRAKRQQLLPSPWSGARGLRARGSPDPGARAAGARGRNPPTWASGPRAASRS